jgi:hypothetical protein
MFERLIELLSIPNKVRGLEAMAALTQAALVELSNSIDEVANELDGLARTVEANDTETAAQIMASAERLRNLRPDTPVEPAPAPAEPTS